MIRAAVIGATGYAGQELVRLLVQHPQVELAAVGSQTYAGKPLAEVFPSLRGRVNLTCGEQNLKAVAADCDVVFLALPHGVASKLVTPADLATTRIIDLGGDFRFKDVATYESWYKTAHGNPAINSEAIYGQPEWNAAAIAKAQLLANPGCYATAASLALLPLLKAGAIAPDSIIIDAKSGVSGAGRALNQGVHFSECNESIKAYKLTTHQHTPEIEEQLQAFSPAARITFSPHLVPMNRGILATAYGALTDGHSLSDLYKLYRDSYDDKPFIRLCEPDSLPETRWVKGSNFCDIGLAVDQRNHRVIVVAALDNLVKGAAGQAIQNMNIMFGLEETSGLLQIPIFPG